MMCDVYHQQRLNNTRYVQTQCMLCATCSSKSTSSLVSCFVLHVVVRVDPVVVVCDEAVVRRALANIALVAIVVFVVAILKRILLWEIYC